MVKVGRANVVLDVNDVDVQHYIDKGYNLLDDDGNVVIEAVPKDLNTLQKAFVEKTKEIEMLKKQLEDLKGVSSERKQRKQKQAEE